MSYGLAYAYSKERSPSPSPSSAYLGGGQSSHSRRSSIQSVGALSEPQEVNPVHVNFVKDTSRFWYKPNIAREDGKTPIQTGDLRHHFFGLSEGERDFFFGGLKGRNRSRKAVSTRS